MADVHEAQHWNNVFLQGRISDASNPANASPALYYLEMQPRFTFDPPGADKVLFRGALGLEALPGLSIWAGAAAIPTWIEDRWRPTETRLWQQVMWSPRLGAWGFVARGRFEQRALETLATPVLRARFLLRATWTLPVDEGKWAGVVFDEFFVDVLGPPGLQGFDQNRAFLGLMRRVTPWWSTEAGYLHVQVGLPGGVDTKQLHTLLVQTALSFL
ncbi:MAG: DUF2490 domain-containing protein [Myxococcota bacterium]